MSGFCYEIKHKTNHNLMTYIGSTNNLSVRCRSHKYECTNSNGKKYNFPVYQYIREHDGWEAWDMNLIYEGDDYKKMEQEIIKDNFDNLINKEMPGRTRAEYHEDNKDKISEYKKDYYKENRYNILERQKEKIPCPHCDKFSTRDHLARHQRSQYCINYVPPESTSSSDSSSLTG